VREISETTIWLKPCREPNLRVQLVGHAEHLWRRVVPPEEVFQPVQLPPDGGPALKEKREAALDQAGGFEQIFLRYSRASWTLAGFSERPPVAVARDALILGDAHAGEALFGCPGDEIAEGHPSIDLGPHELEAARQL